MKKQYLFSLILLAGINTLATHELYNPEAENSLTHVAAPEQKVEREQRFWEKRFYNKKFLVLNQEPGRGIMRIDIRQCSRLMGLLAALMSQNATLKDFSFVPHCIHLGCTISNLVQDPAGWIGDLVIEWPLEFASFTMFPYKQKTVKINNKEGSSKAIDPRYLTTYYAINYLLSAAYTKNILPWAYEDAEKTA